MSACCPVGLLDEQLMVKVVRNKLMSPPCRNQGFVLDGFPKTYEQAKELFYGDATLLLTPSITWIYRTDIHKHLSAFIFS